jgi:hypothetical protein
MTFAGVTAKVIDTVLALGGEFVKSVTYVRPPGVNVLTGAVSSSEIRVTASAVVPGYAPAGFTVPHQSMRHIYIKAAALVAIPSPAAGDHLILPDGTRLDVLDAERDPTEVFWGFDCKETPGEDYGDLTSHGSSADYGDLTAYTTGEDYGPLW